MSSRSLEVSVGLFVAAGIVALILLSMQVSNLAGVGNAPTYRVQARFENIGGLKVRAAVSIGGVQIGRVADIDYDQQTYQAVVHMAISTDYAKLPEDTAAGIFTAGLLGENYVGLEPGGSDVLLSDGDEIQLTQSALVLEQVIGQFLYNQAQDGAAAQD